jgi:hypothetical protein
VAKSDHDAAVTDAAVARLMVLGHYLIATTQGRPPPLLFLNFFSRQTKIIISW